MQLLRITRVSQTPVPAGKYPSIGIVTMTSDIEVRNDACLVTSQKVLPKSCKRPAAFPLPARNSARDQKAYSLSVSKKSFMRAKKPVDSGLLSFEEICSNSCSNSRCRFVSFCGVSICTWI